ncbi:MAG: ribbon-helix-helix protein, CopG family [bacterium]|nr:ribbon-helix-helix protein, CopG family [bacterium]MCY3889235.1 ribbon-helix-helix protein, CopG family [bacterium]MCY3963056.1 ribbon-helix-helix protein, CopG family [bacterium]MCY4133699.1 ribbon-helix-helix protein, CopG family [bacterium]
MRTQIALEPEQHAGVKRKAAELGISMAEYIRRLVERDLAAPRSQADISDIFALGGSGGSDIAAEGKSAIAEAVEADWIRRTR